MISMDLLPTFASLAGLTAEVDGLDLAPVLADPSAALVCGNLCKQLLPVPGVVAQIVGKAIVTEARAGIDRHIRLVHLHVQAKPVSALFGGLCCPASHVALDVLGVHGTTRALV